jgi:hypothetical protein
MKRIAFVLILCSTVLIVACGIPGDRESRIVDRNAEFVQTQEAAAGNDGLLNAEEIVPETSSMDQQAQQLDQILNELKATP